MTQAPETAIIINVPEIQTQVLVRLPGHIPAEDIAVDFRPVPEASWSPSLFFGDQAVEVRHQ